MHTRIQMGDILIVVPIYLDVSDMYAKYYTIMFVLKKKLDKSQ